MHSGSAAAKHWIKVNQGACAGHVALMPEFPINDKQAHFPAQDAQLILEIQQGGAGRQFDYLLAG